ncbi:MAG: polysaccharide biosynthesis protein, partial [Fibrobacter sp.]|nr:polysaccharide biosynthesis protein [Fibrobacter sp.]
FIGKQLVIDNNKFIAQLRTLRDAALENDEEATLRALREIVPTFTTPEEYTKKATASMQAIQKTA